MKSILILKNIQVENANAINGLTYGFPAMSHFLGFTHALSRKLTQKYDLALKGCAVISHRHQVHAHRSSDYGHYVFSLTRNPIDETGSSPSFVEEGRMHMNISLVIECDFNVHDEAFFSTEEWGLEEKCAYFKKLVKQYALSMRVAGGYITDIGSIEFKSLSDSDETREMEEKKILYSLLPGFALIDRSFFLAEHFEKLKQENQQTEMIDAWFDFFSVKFQAEEPQEDNVDKTNQKNKVKWKLVEKVKPGWLVPIVIGFKAISKLYDNGEVKNTRDNTTPFRFVENVYGVGEWISPHRIQSLKDIFWNYDHIEDMYLFKNDFKSEENLIDFN